MQKKIVLVFGIIFITVGVIAGGITLWRIATQPGAILGPVAQPTPAPAEQIFHSISIGNAISPKRDITGERVRYFDAGELKFKDVDFLTMRPTELSGTEFQNVFDIIWSPDPNLVVLVEYTGGFADRPAALLKNIPANAITPLDERVRAIAWSPDGKRIAYHWRDDAGGENAIFTSAPDLSGRRLVMPIQILAVRIFWLDENRLLIAEKPAPGIQPLIILRNLGNNTSRIVLNNKFGASVLPSPDGDKILVSFALNAEGTHIMTEILNSEGEHLGTPPFATLAEKCAWGADSETIYCAVPAFLPPDGGLPFSYWTGEVASNDLFIAYKFTTDEIRQITQGPINVDAIDLVVSGAEDAFAFINRLDGRLTILKP
jgi:hypothetical protein